MYGEVPPDTVAVHDTDWPTSNFVLDGHDDRIGVDGGVYADTTVRVPDFTLLVVSGVVALSVIMIFACSVFPARSEGIVHVKVLDVPVIPVKSWFATSVPVIVLVIR